MSEVTNRIPAVRHGLSRFSHTADSFIADVRLVATYLMLLYAYSGNTLSAGVPSGSIVSRVTIEIDVGGSNPALGSYL